MEETSSASANADLNHLLHHSAFAILTDRAFLRITGSDATRWLNGMVTNSVQSLAPGEGNYNFLLNAQGRILGDCTIYRDPEGTEPAFVLETDATQVGTIQALLDKFIIMDDVELTRMDSYRRGVLLLGPDAANVLNRIQDPFLGTGDLSAQAPLRLGHYGPTATQVTTPAPGLVPRFYITAAEPMPEDIARHLGEAGAVQISPETLEHLRILEGRPRFGIDITDRHLPQETNQAHALHFAKGCYLGQEIVERIRSRGQVHRLFTPFTLEGSLPNLPTPLASDGKPVGELTSASEVTLDGSSQMLALGYARRDALDTRATFTYSGGIALPRSTTRSGEPANRT